MRVFQMVATDKKNSSFEPNTINDDFHAEISLGGPRTVCGIQLNGDDGVAPGSDEGGFVTCPQCAYIIEEIQGMKNWRKI